MSAAVAMHILAASNRRKSCWLGTPEIYFRKTIDNSRLVKVEDPRRAREMRIFGFTLCCLFLLVMGYALQHFRAIEYGYKIETLRSQRDGLAGMNQALRLEEASWRDPERPMALASPLPARRQKTGPPAHRPPRSPQRHPLSGQDRRSMAAPAQKLPALADRLSPLPPVEPERPAGPAQPPPPRQGAAGGRQTRATLRRQPRQS